MFIIEKLRDLTYFLMVSGSLVGFSPLFPSASVRPKRPLRDERKTTPGQKPPFDRAFRFFTPGDFSSQLFPNHLFPNWLCEKPSNWFARLPIATLSLDQSVWSTILSMGEPFTPDFRILPLLLENHSHSLSFSQLSRGIGSREKRGIWW